MADVFVSKVRPLGSSMAVIIPSKIVKAEKLRPGKEVTVSIINPNWKQLEALMGTVRETERFERDRRDRV